MAAVQGDADTGVERRAVTIAPDFDPTPSIRQTRAVEITVASDVPGNVEAVAVPVGADGTGAARLGLEVAALASLGFDGNPGQTHLVLADGGPLQVAVGVGDPASIDADGIRDAAAAFALATRRQRRLAARIPALAHVDAATAAQVIVEGILLARYAYEPLKSKPGAKGVASIALIADPTDRDAVTTGAERGRILASATLLARDLANTPPAHLTAPRIADVAVAVGADRGLEVEVFDQAALTRLGCGGLLGVNAGSTDEPRMVKLTYRPAAVPGASARPATSRWWARASCTTRAASASSRRTPCTRR